jgi:hypothetical protein
MEDIYAIWAAEDAERPEGRVNARPPRAGPEKAAEFPGVSRVAKQLRQLGDVEGYAPRLVTGEQVRPVSTDATGDPLVGARNPDKVGWFSRSHD